MYDYNNMQLVKLLLHNGGCFVDVGANIGAYTLIASESALARVIAIEPHPTTYQQLQDNVARNCRNNVELIRAAAGRAPGQISITDTPGSSTTHVVAAPSAGTITVPIQRLDSLLAGVAAKPVVIKIDVEGFEGEVLAGLGTTIYDVSVLLVEINGLGDERNQGSASLTDQLTNAGFLGPLYFDADSNRFSDVPVHWGEDPVFLNALHVQQLTVAHALHIPSRSSTGN